MPAGNDDLFTLGEDMADGLHAHEVAVGVKQNKEADVRAALTAAVTAQNNFKAAQTEGLDSETGQRVRLFDPRRQRWSEHFAWSDDGTRIHGRTPCGRATVLALQLNHLIAVTVRREWVAAGWHPPSNLP